MSPDLIETSASSCAAALIRVVMAELRSERVRYPCGRRWRIRLGDGQGTLYPLLRRLETQGFW
jgi:DNA-binding PadR family transcriptional regulator